MATNPSILQPQHQLVMHESAECKSMSQDVGTQTVHSEFSSCNLQPEHPFTTAHLAEALAEGTRLLMAAPESTAPMRQQITHLPAGLRAAPWTLLTQSNIQLRLRPVVAAAGTQTEDVGLSDQPSDSTIAAAAARHDAPQGGTKLKSVPAAQLAASAALPMPSQASYTTATPLPPAASATKKGKGKGITPSSSRPANRQAPRHRRSPNAHLMFQCQVGAFPFDTFAPAIPASSCQPQTADCLTPARPSNLEKRRRSSVSCLSPPLTTSALQPAADTAADHGQAATSAADPLEIQFAEAGTSCKSASRPSSPAASAPGPVKKPSQVQASLQHPEPAGKKDIAGLHSSRQSDKATALTNASETSTTKRDNVFPSLHPRKADVKNSTDSAAASAAAAPKASSATPSSKAAAAINPALPDATPTVSLSPQTIQANVAAHPASTAQEPAQRHGQDDAQPTTHLVSASPAQAASHHSAALGRTLPGPKAPTAVLVPLAPGSLRNPHQAANASPGNRTCALTPFSPAHKAAPSSKQGKQHMTATVTKGTPNAAVHAVCSKAATQTAPSSPSQVRTRGKSHIQSSAQQQLDSACTADALRSDLVSTAGCHVTRRLVQHLLEPISQPVAGARAGSQPTRGTAAGAGHSMAKGAQPPASKGRGSGHRQATEAGRTASAQALRSSQPSQANKATGTQAASITSKGQVPNADHSKQANHSKQAGKDKHRLLESKAVTVKERQQSMPPLSPPTAKATQPKEAAQKATDAMHANRAKGKTGSILELNQPQTAQAVAINLTSDRKKTGSSIAAGKQQTSAVMTVNTSTADKEKAPHGSNKLTDSGGSKPHGSVTESKESQPAASSASQAQSGCKRLRSDASAAASAPAKRPKVSHPLLC